MAEMTSKTAASGAALEVHLLGVVDFESATALQERLVFETSGRSDCRGTLLICEHPPHVSMGREASARHLLAERQEFEARLMPIEWIGRGGGAFVHAPGQLAVYPILPLDRLGIDVVDYRQRLEQCGLDACRAAKVGAKRRDEAPGLWSRGGQLGLFGAAVKHWTTYYGLYLNVEVDPGFLGMAQSNDLGERATSLSAQRLRRVPMSLVRQTMLEAVAHRFGYERFHTYTGHPFLVRTNKTICLHA